MAGEAGQIFTFSIAWSEFIAVLALWRTFKVFAPEYTKKEVIGKKSDRIFADSQISSLIKAERSVSQRSTKILARIRHF